MEKMRVVKYYRILKSVFWTGIIMTAVTILSLYWNIRSQTVGSREAEVKKTYHTEYGKLESRLQNTEECYLCGSSGRSLMDYYRNFDTIGIIGLNEWCVLDLHLKEYDENGKETENPQGGKSFFGNTQGVSYHVSSIPSRGMANATISSERWEFEPDVVEKHLCQICLDKVIKTLDGYQVKGEEERYIPFVLVDFDTLKLYPMQRQNAGCFIRDYWVDIDYGNDIKIEVYYLPERTTY